MTLNGTGRVVSSPSGIVCPPLCDGTFAQATTVTLSATATDAGATFLRWGGACAGSTNTCTLTLDQDRQVEATFASQTTTSVTTTTSIPAPAPTPSPAPPAEVPPTTTSGGAAGAPPPNRPPSARFPGAQRIFDQVDQALKSLARANIAFNVPTKIRLGQTAEIHLLLSPALKIRQLKETIKALGRKEGAQVRVSREMEARLTGLGFKINAITGERQPVSGSGVTEWLWEIEPTETGTQHLHLTLTAFIDLDGRESARPVRTFDRPLTINVTWYHRLSGFASDNWQWLWAAILTPLAGLLVGLWKARGNSSGNDASLVGVPSSRRRRSRQPRRSRRARRPAH